MCLFSPFFELVVIFILQNCFPSQNIQFQQMANIFENKQNANV